MRHPKLGEMFKACESNVVVLVVANDQENILEERLITLDPMLVSDKVILLDSANIEEAVSVGAWEFGPRTRCHMGVDWEIQENG